VVSGNQINILQFTYCTTRDLRIRNFCSNRISGYDSNSNQISNRISGQSFTASMLNFCWLPYKTVVQIRQKYYVIATRLLAVAYYLCLLLTVYQPTRTLRSSDTGLLYRPGTSSDFESYCFTSAALTIWNSLSVTTRTANCIGTFRSRLKTDLFAKAYAA